MLEAQRAAFFAELPVSLAVRRDRLTRAADLIEQHGDALCAALVADGANRDAESAWLAEVAPALGILRAAIDGVGAWMDRRVRRSLIARLGGGDHIEHLPIGVVGISVRGPMPLVQAVDGLAGALAAGNRAVLQFGAGSPNLSDLIARLLPDFFDALEVTIVPGGVLADGAVDLLATGGQVGGGAGGVMLSGRSAAILGRSADVAAAADNIVAHRRSGGDPWFPAPDYLLVPDDQEEAVAAWLWRAAMEPAAGAARPVHHDPERLARLLDDARARGGEVMAAEARGAGLPLYIIRHARADMLVLREAVCAPILPLCNYARIKDAIAALHEGPPPPALHYFGRDAAERRTVVQRTLSSAIAINGRTPSMGKDAMAIPDPIDSGEAGFRRFSRTRLVVGLPIWGLSI
ncbi:MAG: aldehyde dehydrogenase family protein [Sphingopyxis sp.]|nr:aldehyde dehydrogenase family protein [Sphingopyxis sp.]